MSSTAASRQQRSQPAVGTRGVCWPGSDISGLLDQVPAGFCLYSAPSTRLHLTDILAVLAPYQKQSDHGSAGSV